MGLVLPALDALLPVADAPAAGSGPVAVGSSTDQLFSALLASLAANAETVTTDAVMDPSILPGGNPESDEDDKPESDPFAALFAMTVPLPALPIVEAPAAAATGTPRAEAHLAVPGSTSEAAVSASSLPNAELVPPPPGESASFSDAATTAQPPATPQAPAGSAAEHAEAAEPPPSTETATAAVAMAEIIVSQAQASPPARVVKAEPPTPDGAPPGEVPPAATEATSVVRPVGNAQTENSDAETKDPGRGRKDAIERPAPRASAQGIAHAAANSAVGELRAAQPEVTGPAPEASAPAPADLPQQLEQVANTVIEQVEAGGGEARIHLDPVDLGEVTIHVRTDGDQVRIEVRAERQEALNLLRDHTQDLSTLLGERGLNLSDVNVGLGRGNGDQTWGQDSRPENHPITGEFASIFGFEDGTTRENHNRLRAAYNPDGAHIYRV